MKAFDNVMPQMFYDAIVERDTMDKVCLWYDEDEPLDIELVFQCVGYALSGLSAVRLFEVALAHNLVFKGSWINFVVHDTFFDTVKEKLFKIYCRHMQRKFRAMEPDSNGKYFYQQGYKGDNNDELTGEYEGWSYYD